MAKEYFINKVLPTTVVGSYPVVKGGSLRNLFDPLHSALETAVADQIKAGIDIISDGQVRGDMIQKPLSCLSGTLPSWTFRIALPRSACVLARVVPISANGRT